MRITAWRVHDTGLVAAPGPYRRLPGLVRHHQGRGDPWPEQVVLEAIDGRLVVEGVGSWPLDEVTARIMGHGPPVTFVIQLPDASHLLAAAAGPETDSLLGALGV